MSWLTSSSVFCPPLLPSAKRQRQRTMTRPLNKLFINHTSSKYSSPSLPTTLSTRKLLPCLLVFVAMLCCESFSAFSHNNVRVSLLPSIISTRRRDNYRRRETMPLYKGMVSPPPYIRRMEWGQRTRTKKNAARFFCIKMTNNDDNDDGGNSSDGVEPSSKSQSQQKNMKGPRRQSTDPRLSSDGGNNDDDDGLSSFSSSLLPPQPQWMTENNDKNDDALSDSLRNTNGSQSLPPLSSSFLPPPPTIKTAENSRKTRRDKRKPFNERKSDTKSFSSFPGGGNNTKTSNKSFNTLDPLPSFPKDFKKKPFRSSSSQYNKSSNNNNSGGGGGGSNDQNNNNNPGSNGKKTRHHQSSKNSAKSAAASFPTRKKPHSSSSPPSAPGGGILDGVLPISELFYQSTQSLVSSNSSPPSSNGTTTTTASSVVVDRLSDDDELPFSAEQSNKLLTTGTNKIQVRRNTAATADDDGDGGVGSRRQRTRGRRNGSGNEGRRDRGASTSRQQQQQQQRTQRQYRKLVRRGMEMLVGGEPINADPPMRSVELVYNGDCEDWAQTITLNSRDFGPLLHTPSVSKVSAISRGLHCENLYERMLHWKICPKDVKDMIHHHEVLWRTEAVQLEKKQQQQQQQKKANDDGSDEKEEMKYNDLLKLVTEETRLAETLSTPPPKEDESRGFAKNIKTRFQQKKPSSRKQKRSSRFDRRVQQQQSGLTSSSLRGHHVSSSSSSNNNSSSNGSGESTSLDDLYLQGGELKFSLGISRTDLESGGGSTTPGRIFKRILVNGISEAIKAPSLGYCVQIHHLAFEENESGFNAADGDMTEVAVEFHLAPLSKKKANKNENDAVVNDTESVVSQINAALSRTVDGGDMALALAAATRLEKGWSEELKERVVEEFLFEVDDYGDDAGDGEDVSLLNGNDNNNNNYEPNRNSNTPENGFEDDDDDGPFGTPNAPSYPPEDIFLGGGNGGVFFDYSETNAPSSPYHGRIGPLLLDTITSRSLQQQPRVIAIGDVHGCSDELRLLLRRCDYRPGDLVVFLGDLVSKGPDSLGVVSMAREIGAIGVRGNHDFEVIRWHQAIKSGADPPMIGSEHFHIASGLSKPDLKWLYSLPWYISSKELGALFVHAGFVSGIRLAKQNPRLMMNMRSILPDGTVTSKFFNNWPWARLWDGPQTVLFGHDADRGLQQYEHAIGLDTGCVYGGRLTACILPEKRLVSVSAKREYFQYRRKHFD